MKQLEGRENTLPQTNSPLTWCRNMLPQPRNTTTTPRQQQGTVKPSLPQQGSRRRVCSRYQCPREKAREDRKSGFRPRFKRGILNGGRCSLQRGSGGRQQRWGSQLDEGSLQRRYHCQLNLPSPSQLPYRHNLMHKRCFFCVVPTTEQVLDPAHGKETRH